VSEPTDQETVQFGIALSIVLYDLTMALVDDETRGGHVAIVALLHAAIRVEVSSRQVGKSAKWYRDALHGVLDEVLDYEERRKAAAL
jgi:hypothetical protein